MVHLPAFGSRYRSSNVVFGAVKAAEKSSQCLGTNSPGTHLHWAVLAWINQPQLTDIAYFFKAIKGFNDVLPTMQPLNERIKPMGTFGCLRESHWEQRSARHL